MDTKIHKINSKDGSSATFNVEFEWGVVDQHVKPSHRPHCDSCRRTLMEGVYLLLKAPLPFGEYLLCMGCLDGIVLASKPIVMWLTQGHDHISVQLHPDHQGDNIIELNERFKGGAS